MYDENNNILNATTRAGLTFDFEFDVLNRVIQKSPEGMPVVTCEYDLAGRPLKVSTPVVMGNPASGEWEVGYDTAGRPIFEEAPDGKTVSFDLDENGNVTTITYPDTYFVERFYDELDRLVDIKLNGSLTAAVHLDYDFLSRKSSLTFANTVQTDFTYEWNEDMSAVEHAFNGSSLDFGYGFDNAHELISQAVSDSQHMWHPGVGGTMEFGTANKLNQLPYSTGSCGRLVKEYNTNGCLVDDGVFKYEYDAENHLISADDGGTVSNYIYDPMQRQIQKDVGGTKTRFVYFGWQRLADYDGGTGSLLNRFVYGNDLDEPLVTIASGGGLTYMHADRAGSIVVLTNSSGVVTNRSAYSPWGENSGISGTSFGFTGQRFDPETGLYYFKNRYYSPKLKRFLQPDKIESTNLYLYVDNNPNSFTDSLGMWGSADFVRHYYRGGGRHIDLIDVGLGEAFENDANVRQKTMEVREHLKNLAKREARDGCENNKKKCKGKVKYQATLSYHTDSKNIEVLSKPLWSVGGGLLNVNANCQVDADCCAKTFVLDCETRYWIKDSFSKPLDIRGTWFQYREELPFGIKYDIEYTFLQKTKDTGKF